MLPIRKNHLCFTLNDAVKSLKSIPKTSRQPSNCAVSICTNGWCICLSLYTLILIISFSLASLGVNGNKDQLKLPSLLMADNYHILTQIQQSLHISSLYQRHTCSRHEFPLYCCRGNMKSGILHFRKDGFIWMLTVLSVILWKHEDKICRQS